MARLPRTLKTIPKIRGGKGPEAKIQAALVKMLRERGWFVKETHGNMYQQGIPDLYCIKRSYGKRWIEVKCPTGYKFTPAQWEDFPRMIAEGDQIWILTAATEAEYQKLFKKPNLWVYMGGFDV